METNNEPKVKGDTALLPVRMRKRDKHIVITLAGVENRSCSQMAAILIKEALKARGIE